MLTEQRITENGIQTIDKVDIAIARIREFEPEEGYYVAFSGGKDSVVILDLVKRARVKFDAHYNLTTVDPPELVKFIKTFPDVERHHPEKTMWQLIVENGMPPLRQMRYCCRILKERGGEGRFVITGVRAAESNKRAGRKMVESCLRDGSKRYLHPIIDWSDVEVWEYIHKHDVRYCSLYNEGWKRLGCVCCPNANQRRQAERWPKIAAAYKRACVRAYDRGLKKGKKYKDNWQNGEQMYEWWINGQPGEKESDQSILFE